MAFSFYALVLLVHIVGAVMWFGGGAYHLSMIMPAVKAAGPAGGAVMQQVIRRGGLGARWFGPVSTVTVLAGFYLYVRGDFTAQPFGDIPGTVLTVGVLFGLAAFIVGLAFQMPVENRMKRIVAGFPRDGPPPAEAMAQMQGLAAKAETGAKLAMGLVGTALVCMAGRFIFT